MALIDLILNLAGLMLWLKWHDIYEPPSRQLTLSLLSTLKPAGGSKSKRFFLVALLVLLFVRALFYWQVGAALGWVAQLHLTPIPLSFRSDFFLRILLYSFLSFGATLGVFYLWLLLLSIVNQKLSDADPQQRWVRLQLGWIARLPMVLRFILPVFLLGGLWVCIHPVLAKMGLLPPAKGTASLMEQSFVIGLGSYFAWKYLLLGVLLLYLLNSYVYLGNLPFWTYINATGRALLRPIAWLPLQLGKIDFAPVVEIVAIFLILEFGERGLFLLYQRIVA
jgi:uncharacterized protein YggT (Ycf19 family)